MIRTVEDVRALQHRMMRWGRDRANIRHHTRAHAALAMALHYLDHAAELAGHRRTHFMRCARDQWRVAVRLVGGQT